MSRLYAVLESDTRRTPAGVRASERVEFDVRWGSKADSLLVLTGCTTWPKGSDVPTTLIQVAPDYVVVIEEDQLGWTMVRLVPRVQHE